AGIIAALDTRSAKPEIEDRDALGAAWRDTAVAVGLDLARVIDIARTRAVLAAERERTQAPLLERGLAFLRQMMDRVRAPERDPLVPDHVLKRDRETIAAAQAVASAVRHLSQREAAFPREALLKAALDF